MPYPLSLNIKLDQNTKVEKTKLLNIINKIIDLSPGGIIKYLELNKPIYARTSCYGHFGRIPDSEGGFSWEKLDLSEKLVSEL
jgi:S-adenosylmethionine synthetase